MNVQWNKNIIEGIAFSQKLTMNYLYYAYQHQTTTTSVAKMSRISDLETDVPSQDVNCTNRHEKLRWFLIMSMVFRLKSRVKWLQWKHCQKMIVSKRANSLDDNWRKKRNWNDTITYKINLIKSVRFLEEMLQLRNATLRTIFRWLKPVAQFTKPKWQMTEKI